MADEAQDWHSDGRKGEGNDETRHRQLEIAISDSGVGILPEDQERIFEPFFTTKDEGTGLGLAIANRIIADHKGYIHVEDNSPRGTSFVIELPALEPDVRRCGIPPPPVTDVRRRLWDEPGQREQQSLSLSQLVDID